MSNTLELPRLLGETEYLKLPSQEKEAYVREILKQTLLKNPHGVTVTQLKYNLPFDRRIIEKYLDIMKFTNEIYTVKIGPSILNIPNHKAMHEATSHCAKFGNHEYQVYTLRNRLGDFAIIQQRKIDKNSNEVTGSLQMPLGDYNNFVMYLKKTIIDMERRGLR